MSQPGEWSLWAALTQWRNWRLPVKVGAILMVPVLGAVALGVLQISDEVGRANSAASIQRLVTLRGALMPLISDIQQERWLSAEQLGAGLTVDPAAYEAQTKVVDKAATQATTLAQQTLADSTVSATVNSRFSDLTKSLNSLSNLRKEVLANSIDADTVTTAYSAVITAALDFDQALSTQFGDSSLTGPATALFDIEDTLEQVRAGQVTMSVAIAAGKLSNTELAAAHDSESVLQDRLADFLTVASPSELATYDQTVSTSAVTTRSQLAQTIMLAGLAQLAGQNNGSNTPLGVTADVWNNAADTMANQLASMQGKLSAELVQISASLQDQASNAAGVDAVILFAILLLATAIGIVIGRHLLRQLSTLRRTVRDVSDNRLPAAVAAINAGETENIAIPPVPVRTTEELGQLARAFDKVLGEAVRSAVGQAQLRNNLGNIFVNLSRRSQGLVERQLRLMEQLEKHEEDPEQLANLFKLDHLATRMRRNNENLMVLSGTEPEHRSGKPLPLPDVLRAAVSEIEHYQRVTVRSAPTIDIMGYASGDLVRLIAELLDNATSFSPPGSPVYVASELMPNGAVRLDIRDDGIGMSESELAEANRRLAASGSVDVPASRQMGLFVAGRLAKRHNIQVAIEEDPEVGGLRAIVIVPPELVRSAGPRTFGPSKTSTALPPVGEVTGWHNELGGLAGGPRPGGPMNGANNGGGLNGSQLGSAFDSPSAFDAPTSFEPASSFDAPSSFDTPSSSYDAPSSFEAPGSSYDAPRSSFEFEQSGGMPRPAGLTPRGYEDPTGFAPPVSNGDSNGHSNGNGHHASDDDDALSEFEFTGEADPIKDPGPDPVTGLPHDAHAPTEVFDAIRDGHDSVGDSTGGSTKAPDLFAALNGAETPEREHAEVPEFESSFDPASMPEFQDYQELAPDQTGEWASFHGHAIADQAEAGHQDNGHHKGTGEDLFAAEETDESEVQSSPGRDNTIFADLPPTGRLGDPPVPGSFAPVVPSPSPAPRPPDGPVGRDFTWFDLPGRAAAGSMERRTPKPVVPPAAGSSVGAGPAPLGPDLGRPAQPETSGVTPGGLPRRVPRNARTGSLTEAPPVEAAIETPAPVSTPSAMATETHESGESLTTTSGLPRRVPRSHLSANLSDRPPATGPAHAAPTSTNPPTKRKPARARGFLDEYQAGVRQGKHRRAPESTDNVYGQEDS